MDLEETGINVHHNGAADFVAVHKRGPRDSAHAESLIGIVGTRADPRRRRRRPCGHRQRDRNDIGGYRRAGGEGPFILGGPAKAL